MSVHQTDKWMTKFEKIEQLTSQNKEMQKHIAYLESRLSRLKRYNSDLEILLKTRDAETQSKANIKKIDDLLVWVCKVSGFSVEQVKSKTRKEVVTEVRHIFCYLAKKHTNATLVDIAAAAGRKDHTTVIWGIKKVKNLMDTEPDFMERVNTIERICLTQYYMDDVKPLAA